MNKYTKYIGQIVKVIMDRPMGTTHPRIPEIYYTQNYGYIPNTMAPDGSEIDAYVLGISKPLTEFTGECIAVIHRFNDNEDKLVVVPKGIDLTDEQIKTLTHFQEKYYKSEIIRTK